MAATIGAFIKQGIHHIFIGPDHILFVISLVLLGGRLATQVKIVTAFTVAHTITLTLATAGLVNPPARWVESLIALSIVLVGLHNLDAATAGLEGVEVAVRQRDRVRS